MNRYDLTHKGGSIFAAMFGAVAMMGVVGVAAMNMIGGPITTASKVTHQNMAQNDLLMNAKIVVMNASTRPNQGDEDGDGYVEPVPFIPTSASSCNITLPTGSSGGCLPGDIGAILTDPWGTQYMYCVWDHGDPASSTNRITGEDSTSGAVLTIISAGPNKRFETPCRAYDGDPATNDDAVNPDGNGDDLIQIYTYAAAVAGSGGLWELKQNEPETAIIDKKLEIGDISSGTGFAFDTATGQGEFPYVKTDFIASKTGGTTPVTMVNNIALDGNWLSGDGGNEGVFVAANGYVGIGTSSPERGLHLKSNGFHGDDIMIEAHNATEPTYGATIHMRRSGGTLAAPAPTKANDEIGWIAFAGYNGTNWLAIADIKSRAETTLSAEPRGSIEFSTRSTGALTERMRITSDGKVGIGINDPQAILEARGNISAYNGAFLLPYSPGPQSLQTVYNALMSSSRGNNDSAAIVLTNATEIDLQNQELVFLLADGQLNDDDGASFVKWNANGFARTMMRIRGNGNVGIKNTQPRQLLHIDDKSTGGADQTVVQVGNGSGSLFLTHTAPHISSNSRYDDGAWRYEANGAATTIRFGSGAGDGEMLFATAPAGNAGDVFTFTPRMRLTGDGKLIVTDTTYENGGRNTTLFRFAGERTDNGAPSTDGYIIRYEEDLFTGTQDGIVFEKTDVNSVNVDGGILFANRGMDGVRVPVLAIRGNQAGRGVGIGTTLPSHLLHIEGIARSTQANFVTSSDVRVKTNIHGIENGLDVISRLRPVTYEYTDEYQNNNADLGGIRRGFIAQEIEEILPDAVSLTQEQVGDQTIEDFRVLNNDDFVPLLVRAVQELKAENKELRERIYKIERTKQ